MQASLIVAAGGSGSRFKSSLAPHHTSPRKGGGRIKEGGPSKLFVKLGGKPVLAHCLETFQKFPQIREKIVTVPRGEEKNVLAMLKENGVSGVRVVAGGRTRAESVLNGIKAAKAGTDWVMVHDGARPFVTEQAVGKLLKEVEGFDGALLSKKVVPTLKEAGPDGKIVRTVDRTRLFEAETPQLIKREVLKKAYKNPEALNATDEASLAESVGARVKLVVHDSWNPKITTAQDLELAERFLGTAQTVTGFGRDIHRLVEGRKMVLGGIVIPFEKGPLGHSDGDALLHAVTDAVLGCMGAGDIGDWFSDKDPKNKNIASTKILSAVLEEAAAKGFEAAHVDTVIVLERPKLGKYKQEMKNKIAALMNLAPENVSIKAKTMEGLGPEGQGLAVSAEAIVTMRRTK